MNNRVHEDLYIKNVMRRQCKPEVLLDKLKEVSLQILTKNAQFLQNIPNLNTSKILPKIFLRSFE